MLGNSQVVNHLEKNVLKVGSVTRRWLGDFSQRFAQLLLARNCFYVKSLESLVDYFGQITHKQLFTFKKFKEFHFN